MSLPAPPTIRSALVPPSRTLLPALPVKVFASELPVPLMSAVPVSVRFSMDCPPRLKLTELRTVSVPCPLASSTMSPTWFTTYWSSPPRPVSVSAPGRAHEYVWAGSA